jgi:hypothetical protein
MPTKTNRQNHNANGLDRWGDTDLPGKRFKMKQDCNLAADGLLLLRTCAATERRGRIPPALREPRAEPGFGLDPRAGTSSP